MFDTNHTVNDVMLCATNYGNLYAQHVTMARNELSLGHWIAHVHNVVLPQWRREGGTNAITVGMRRTIAALLQDYYEEHVLEGAA